MDFTIKQYKELVQVLIDHGYSFQTFDEFIKKPEVRSIVLRHDVDLLPYNSLLFAKIQNKHQIKGTYYFRAVPESWNENVISEIAELGHEIGYHYECLTTFDGDISKGIQDFQNNLNNLREIVPVSTICMHGSPMSKYDSKDLWKKYDYRDFDIIGEPYFDINFKEVFYLTDTGRMWDGHKVSVRDKVDTLFEETYHSTNQIIDAIKSKQLPNQIMLTFHPQRWHESKFMWIKEYILQNLKNIVKKYFFVKNNRAASTQKISEQSI